MLFLSIRQLLSRPQQTTLTFIGIMLGTATYIIFTGIMLGFQEYLIEKMINDSPHVTVNPRDENISEETFSNVFFGKTETRWIVPPSGKRGNTSLTNVLGWFEILMQDKEVAAFSPRLTRQVILKQGRVSFPISLVGIDAVKEQKVTTLHKNITSGSFLSIEQSTGSIILGYGLVSRLGTRKNATIIAVSQTGEKFPLRVSGILRTGIKQVDDTTAYASIKTVQKVADSAGEISQIGIRLFNVDKAEKVTKRLSLYTKDKVLSWSESNESLLSVFRTQDIMRNAISAIIVIVIAFGIYNILNMVVSQKKKEIAILRSIGYEPLQIIQLFLFQGSFLGITGGLAGLMFGALCNYLISQIEVNQSFGTSNTMMVSWNSLIFIQGFLITVLATTIAGILPARSASKLSPIAIIRGS